MIMNNIRKFVSLVVASVPFVVSAQDIDPTVVVNRAYEGKLMEVHKPLLEMAIPDTVTRFDLDFDYSVFEKPYKGAYEFNPYVLTMQPASAVQSPKKFFLKAGLGYTLNPEFDMVWSPVFKGDFRMDVYAFHRSYVGSYRSFRPEADASSYPVVIDRWKQAGGDKARWKGYDLLTRAGVDGVYDWKTGAIGFDVAYHGLASKDLRKTRAYDALDVSLAVSSKSSQESYFMYDIKADYRFAEDKIVFIEKDDYVGEHIFDVNAVLGQVFTHEHKMLFDVDLDLAAYNHSVFAGTAGQFSIVPHYVFARGRWHVDAGLRIAKILRSNDPDAMFQTREQVVYPDVKAWFAAIPDALRVYAVAGGGNRLNTYSSLLQENHHVDTAFGWGRWKFMDADIERVSVYLGIDGRIGSKFSYDVHTGYANYSNALLDAVLVSTVKTMEGPQYVPGVGYAPYQKYFAAASWSWKTESFRFDGDVEYAYVWGIRNADGLFAPSPLTGKVAFEYNWSRRVYAGVDCMFATGRKGSILDLTSGDAVHEALIPGYADLGLYLEVSASHMLSFWARGGNLLNMTIQRNPLYAERGAYFTLGICLNL